MSETMTVTMDSAGRFVLPKRARTSLGLEPGQRLSVTVHDDRVELTPVPIEADLVEHGGGVQVITPTEDIKELTPDDVTEAVERTRR